MNGTSITGSRDFSGTLPVKSVESGTSSILTANFMRPEEVVADLGMTQAEKRALLASWASDAHAVPDAPELRQLENGAVVRVEDILRALTCLDRGASGERTRWSPRRSTGLRVRFSSGRKRAARRWSSDDDDDPPPCPAMIFRPAGGPLSSGAAAEPALAA